MPKYVDVDEMKKRIKCDVPEMRDYRTLMIFIDNLPEADVEPVRHAFWSRKSGVATCSCCSGRMFINSEGGVPYCPLCGSKMEFAKGHWIEIEERKVKYQCSQCGWETERKDLLYCEKCGVDMNGEEKQDAEIH